MQRIRLLFDKSWNSPTIMTWFSLTSKPFSFLLLLPLILTRFSQEEIALWYVFNLYLSIKRLSDFGFSNALIRVVSYAYAGRKKIGTLIKVSDEEVGYGPNKELLKKIIATMNNIYVFMAYGALGVLGLCTFLVIEPINQTSNISENYIAWLVIVLVSGVSIYERKYTNYLNGINEIALVKKWDGIFSYIALGTNLLIVFVTNSFLFLVLSSQFWLLVRFLRNRILAYKVKNELYRELNNRSFDKATFNEIWGPAWKGGVSSLVSQGVIYSSGIIYSQVANSNNIAGYLFALKIYEILRSFAQAPFQSRIPKLSQLRAQNKIKEWKDQAQKGMFLGSATFVLGIIILGIIGQPLFTLIGSNISFPEFHLWYALGFAYFFHRYGSMHTHLYMTTNKVNSHISDTISGGIFLLTCIFLYKKIEVLAFPISMLVSYVGFYIWFALYFSIKVINEPIIKFEKKASLIPLFLLISTFIIQYLLIN